ncbi:hypothetical protein NXW27_18755 [Phocaeicola dorei]|nr:hypothetical protein [Phocaeicola dorei]
MTSLPHGGIGQMPCQTSSRIFDKALATAEIARYNSVEQRSYEENLKVYRALINVVRTTERKGLAKDMAEGRPSERKNSLFFGSDRIVCVSAVYHTIISTCKIQSVPVLDYFKRFFSEIVKGRRDYEHLLPLTIGLN